MDPIIKGLVNQLRLPDPIKGFLSWILMYIVSAGPGQRELWKGRKHREKTGSESRGLLKEWKWVGSERRMRPREW